MAIFTQDSVARLRRRLAGELPGQAAQFLMAPAGRARVRPSPDAAPPPRQGAVLLFLYAREDDWRLLLMKRSHYPGAHAGQVCIPGGCLEPGEDPMRAALREFAEETGVRVGHGQVLGRLSELYIPTSDFVVRPYVACGARTPRFEPDPVEVERLIELPLRTLLRADTLRRGRIQHSDGAPVEAPYFAVDGDRVWGATAMILSEFNAIIRDMS